MKLFLNNLCFTGPSCSAFGKKSKNIAPVFLIFNRGVHQGLLDVCMESCPLLLTPPWLRLAAFLLGVLTVMVVRTAPSNPQSVVTTHESMTNATSNDSEPHASALRKPVMVSNSTQTEDGYFGGEQEDKPVLLTGLVLAIAAACFSVLAVVILIICIICAIRCYWDRPMKDVPFGPRNIPGADPTYVPVYVDRKMAQSAQMFFYQFQKQQILAKESEHKRGHSVDSDSCSEADTKDGHIPMISCPGLALKHGEDLEVRNPLFFEEVPTWNGSVATDDEYRRDGSGNEVTRSHEQVDMEYTNEEVRNSTDASSSPVPQPYSTSTPYPPPSSPTASTPTPPTRTPSIPELGEIGDALTRDVNENLTQIVREAEKKPIAVKSKEGSDSPSPFADDSRA